MNRGKPALTDPRFQQRFTPHPALPGCFGGLLRGGRIHLSELDAAIPCRRSRLPRAGAGRCYGNNVAETWAMIRVRPHSVTVAIAFGVEKAMLSAP